MLKNKVFRSSKLLRFAEGMSCVACGIEDGTVVSAHSNLLEHGKGRGIKAHDGMAAWLCSRCHTEYDQGGLMNKEQKRDFILTMICRTHMEMFDRGLLEVKGGK